MLDSKSPFYVKPGFNLPLLSWGLKFMKNATQQHVDSSAAPLRDFGLFSQHCYEEWTKIPGFDFAYEKKGLLEYFQTAANEEHAHHTAAVAKTLGLAAKVITAGEVQAMEPQAKLNIKGALYFECDAHLYPEKLMKGLLNILKHRGVKLVPNEEVSGFEKTGANITGVKTNTHIQCRYRSYCNWFVEQANCGHGWYHDSANARPWLFAYSPELTLQTSSPCHTSGKKGGYNTYGRE